ncbi:TIGR03016 family PEP-CTERM system-associated outer membrane protein [Alteromonadaceae bacterium M269]|nr:TIGR03016 family PEP-CTERM system-associated outer membrane protein [Alteromonadaceae bacterium M269]
MRKPVSVLGLTMLSLQCFAGELEIKPRLSTSILSYETQTDSDAFPEGDVLSVVANPSVTLTYESPIFDTLFLINHRNIRQDFEDQDDISSNFTEYTFRSSVDIVKNYLTAQASSNLNFRNTDPTQTLVNDFFLGGGDLTKVRNSGAGLFFTTPNPRLFGIDWSGQFAKIESEQTTTPDQSLNLQNLDSENTQYNFRFYEGDNFQRVSWNLTTEFQDTTREDSNQNDLRSRTIDGRISFALLSKLRLTLVGNNEENQLRNGNDNDLGIGSLDFTSYGAGLEWYSSPQRRIAVTFNRTDDEDDGNDNTQEDGENNFLGVDVNWAFSSRTNLQANLSRRFFGESKSGRFNYNTRSFRISASYNESLTTFSRLLANNEDLGVFVCPAGDPQLSSCFQPDTLSFQLQPDQQFFSFFEQIPEISEEVTLRKFGSLDFGYNRTRLTVSLALSASQTEFLETQREQDNNSIRLSTNYQLSQKTTLVANANFTRTEFTDTNTKDDVRNHSIGINREFSQKLSADFSFRFLDRDSDDIDRDLQDRRLTLELTYNF